MKDCPNRKENLSKCNCSYEPCERKGVCCVCVSYHRRQGQIPACFFPAEAEKGFDRSVGNFIRSQT